MKELFESAYQQGFNADFFHDWWKANESKIDDAIQQYIKDNYPTLYSAFVIAKLAKQYDIQVVDSKDATPITPEIFGLNSTLYNDLKSIREEKDQMVERGVLK